MTHLPQMGKETSERGTGGSSGALAFAFENDINVVLLLL